MNSKILDKIEKIISFYINNEFNNKNKNIDQSKLRLPKIWNMDTSFYTILAAFFKKLENIKNSGVDLSQLITKTIKIKYVKRNKKNNPLYTLIVDGFDVLPSSRIECAAVNTISQYIRLLNFFDLIIIPDINKSKLNQIINDESELVFSLNIRNYIDDLHVDDLLTTEKAIEYMIAGIKKDIISYIDASYCIFVHIIWTLSNQNKDILNKINEIIGIRFVTKKEIKDTKKQVDNIYDVVNKSGRETYGVLTKKIINNLKHDCPNEFILNFFLDKFIISYYYYQNFENIEHTIDNEMLSLAKEMELNRKIQQERAKLRDNILTSRKINDNHYSDLEPLDKNVVFINDCVAQQEAAHIFPVSEIKKMIKKKEILFESLSDPNNGILMDHVYHDAFDRGWIRFNSKGEMVPMHTWKKHYVNENTGEYIKYPLMKIKDNVFNKMMSNYMERRK